MQVPRGDGRKTGEARPLIKRTDTAQYIPRWLQDRIDWWEKQLKEAYTSKDKHDGQGNSYRKPGSQQK